MDSLLLEMNNNNEVNISFNDLWLLILLNEFKKL